MQAAKTELILYYLLKEYATLIDNLLQIVDLKMNGDLRINSLFVSESKPWMDKLQALTKMASRHGSSARIFKAFADPPTTSLQRLKVKLVAFHL